MKAVTTLVLFDEKLYDGNGLVRRWVRGVTESMYWSTLVRTPVRTGHLRAGLLWGVDRVGPKQVQGRVESTAPHSLYVLHGTAYQGHRYIYSAAGWAAKPEVDRVASHVPGHRRAEADGGWYLVIRDGGPKFHLRVHGQRANNFLLAGYNATALKHRALHRIAPRLIRVR